MQEIPVTDTITTHLEKFVQMAEEIRRDEEAPYVGLPKAQAAEVLLRQFLFDANKLRSLQHTEQDRWIDTALLDGERLLAQWWCLHNSHNLDLPDPFHMLGHVTVAARKLYYFWCAAVVFGVLEGIYKEEEDI